MKKLKDYEWLCNRYKVQDFILNDRSWEEISRTPLSDAFLSALISIEILNSSLRGLKILCEATNSHTKPNKNNG